METETKGIIYYKLDSDYHYAGDSVKGCGLTGGEIDGNFHFLRGYDISSFDMSQDQEELVITRLNGDKLSVNIKERFTDYDFEYDSENGILKITMPYGKTIDLEGFITESYFQKYTDDIESLNNKITELETVIATQQEQLDDIIEMIKIGITPSIDMDALKNEVKKSIINSNTFKGSNDISVTVENDEVKFEFGNNAIFGAV